MYKLLDYLSDEEIQVKHPCAILPLTIIDLFSCLLYLFLYIQKRDKHF